jgi:hypothetical protein
MEFDPVPHVLDLQYLFEQDPVERGCH